MTVWELTGQSTWGGESPTIGLFLTKEKAEAKIKLMQKTAKEHGWVKNGFKIYEVNVE